MRGTHEAGVAQGGGAGAHSGVQEAGVAWGRSTGGHSVVPSSVPGSGSLLCCVRRGRLAWLGAGVQEGAALSQAPAHCCVAGGKSAPQDEVDEIEVYGSEAQSGTQLATYSFEVRTLRSCLNTLDLPFWPGGAGCGSLPSGLRGAGPCCPKGLSSSLSRALPRLLRLLIGVGPGSESPPVPQQPDMPRAPARQWGLCFPSHTDPLPHVPPFRWSPAGARASDLVVLTLLM